LQRQPYDVVLMDVQMPELDGIAATRRIRTIISTRRQPVIVAMTAGVMPDERAACDAVGMDIFLCKPVRVEDLVEVLRQAEALRLQRMPRIEGAIPSVTLSRPATLAT
jgi:CheY-like chemotaxis protein